MSVSSCFVMMFLFGDEELHLKESRALISYLKGEALDPPLKCSECFSEGEDGGRNKCCTITKRSIQKYRNVKKKNESIYLEIGNEFLTKLLIILIKKTTK